MVDLTIRENDAGQRLDRFLRKYLRKAPLGMIYRMIRKDVKLNGKRAGEDSLLREGDVLTLYIEEGRLDELKGEPVRIHARKQFRVVYEDGQLLIVDKPRGLLTHGDSREKKNTLANQVKGYLQEKGEYDPASERTFSPAPANRLDRNTTGLVIFGKSAEVVRELTGYLREGDRIRKYYLTITAGKMTRAMRLDDSLVRDRDSNTTFIAKDGDGAKKASTVVTPLMTTGDYSLAEVRLVTGRTHQIRAHLAHEGFPLIGDAKYGDRDVNDRARGICGITTQLLHAYRLEFRDTEGILSYMEGRSVSAKAPGDFRNAASKLGFKTIDWEAYVDEGTY